MVQVNLRRCSTKFIAVLCDCKPTNKSFKSVMDNKSLDKEYLYKTKCLAKTSTSRNDSKRVKPLAAVTSFLRPSDFPSEQGRTHDFWVTGVYSRPSHRPEGLVQVQFTRFPFHFITC